MAGSQSELSAKPRQDTRATPSLELGDKLLDTLGVEAEDLFNNVLTKKGRRR